MSEDRDTAPNLPADPRERLALIREEASLLNRDFFDDDHAPADLAALIPAVTSYMREGASDDMIDALERLARRAEKVVKAQDERLARIHRLARGEAPAPVQVDPLEPTHGQVRAACQALKTAGDPRADDEGEVARMLREAAQVAGERAEAA